MDDVRRRAWLLLACVDAFLVAVLVAGYTSFVGIAAFAAIALVTITAILVAPRLHQPATRAPWHWFAAGALAFLVSVVIQRAMSVRPGGSALWDDVFTMSGYTMACLALLHLLRRPEKGEWGSLWDGAIVVTGALPAATVLFTIPAALSRGDVQWASFIPSLYPLYDLLGLFLLLRLGFTMAVRLPSYWALTTSLTMLLVGDVAGVWDTGHGGGIVPMIAIDVVFAIGYASIGISALHPSMARLSSLEPQSVDNWSPRRLLVLVPSILIPPVVLVSLESPGTGERWVIAAAIVVTVGLLLRRSLEAVQSSVVARDGLRHQALHDALTGLPNRLHLLELVQEELDAGPPDALPGHRPVWLICLDLDHFGLVNDGWGHEAGDRVIVEVGRVLGQVTPPGATLARIGGDEFAVLLRAGREEVRRIADDLREAVRHPISVDGIDFILTTSLGLASADGCEGAVELIRDADTAMGRAKSQGRDRSVIFGTEMRDRVRERVELDLALRNALAHEQLRVAYQPIIDLVSERVTGCEALLRWQHPTRGAIPPSAFIPVAEESGLIVDIGVWVLRTAVHQVALWRAAGTVPENFVLSVNVSTRQLGDGSLPRTVAEVLEESGLPAANLSLEITESAMLDQADRVIEVLLQIRELGVGLSVDDFGTGYSSLSYLSRLPVTTVKLDRCFVERLDGEENDDAIVRAVQAMSTALDLGVVAEGVETAGQRDALRSFGVAQGQGWLWGAAVSPDEFLGRFCSGAPLSGVL